MEARICNARRDGRWDVAIAEAREARMRLDLQLMCPFPGRSLPLVRCAARPKISDSRPYIADCFVNCTSTIGDLSTGASKQIGCARCVLPHYDRDTIAIRTRANLRP